MYSKSMYQDWDAVVITMRVSDPMFDQIRSWCHARFGPTNRRPHHFWDWGTNAGYSLWFVFKNKDDCALFVLTWSDNVNFI